MAATVTAEQAEAIIERLDSLIENQNAIYDLLSDVIYGQLLDVMALIGLVGGFVVGFAILWCLEEILKA